jgi:plasmid stability protein
MRTLYLRNVPDDVAERLEVLAARSGMSVSVYSVKELTEVARRADNMALLAARPDLDVDVEAVLDDLRSGRSGP